MKPDADEVVFSSTPGAVAIGNVLVILLRSPNSVWLLSLSSGRFVAGSLLKCLCVGLVMRCGRTIACGTTEMDMVCDTGVWVRRWSACSSVDTSELSGVVGHRSGGLWSPVEKDGTKGQRSYILPKTNVKMTKQRRRGLKKLGEKKEEEEVENDIEK